LSVWGGKHKQISRTDESQRPEARAGQAMEIVSEHRDATGGASRRQFCAFCGADSEPPTSRGVISPASGDGCVHWSEAW
jgi:hypothetical protein